MPTTVALSRSDNERRVARMNAWIDLARKASDEHSAHVRFVLYWIAYEAAYKAESSDPSDSRATDSVQRRTFHHRVARYDRGRLPQVLRQYLVDVTAVLELRQAHPSFWQRWRQDGSVESPDDWDRNFRGRTRKATQALRDAIENWSRGGANQRTAEALDTLFLSLGVVRNQIVHGASAGSHSHGRTQVLLGARLLHALVPCFRDSVASNLDEDWGQPPFPRVGTGPDDKCPPPWLQAGSARTRGTREPRSSGRDLQ
ncbi:MAG: hypothetical protein OXH75_18775 [Acidobacteria bacterium]|nr:hypothetical protein [Acidobacteriota bacterium]